MLGFDMCLTQFVSDQRINETAEAYLSMLESESFKFFDAGKMRGPAASGPGGVIQGLHLDEITLNGIYQDAPRAFLRGKPA